MYADLVRCDACYYIVWLVGLGWDGMEWNGILVYSTNFFRD